jgi:hypothetical protein
MKVTLSLLNPLDPLNQRSIPRADGRSSMIIEEPAKEVQEVSAKSLGQRNSSPNL